MELTALGLLVLGLLLAEPASRALATARWPSRDPVGALLVWQAVGLASGLALIGSGLAYALAPLGPSFPAATSRIVELAGSGRLPDRIGLDHALALAAALALALRLLGVLTLVAVRTLRSRHRHRELLDLLGTPWPAAPGARVLDHPTPVAYCVPGLLHARLVVSAGALERLEPAAVRAVLAHEWAHLRERHDLVMLPFVAWRATAPFVPGMCRAQLAVTALIEMRADDVAAAAVTPAELSGALRSMGAAAPAAAFSSFTDAIECRLDRIVDQHPPLPVGPRLLVRLGALALVLAPAAVLVLLG